MNDDVEFVALLTFAYRAHLFEPFGLEQARDVGSRMLASFVVELWRRRSSTATQLNAPKVGAFLN